MQYEKTAYEIEDEIKLPIKQLLAQINNLVKQGYLAKEKRLFADSNRPRCYYKATDKVFKRKSTAEILASSDKSAGEYLSEDKKKMRANPNLRIIRLSDTVMPTRGKIQSAYKGIASSFYVI
jgi:predicted transcriptional regulator